MTTDLEKVSKIAEFIEKNAFFGAIVGAAGKAGWGGLKMLGGAFRKNPMGTLGNVATVGFGASEIAESSAKAMKGATESKILGALDIPGPTM